MEHRRNAFKSAILKGERQIGFWCQMTDPGGMEMLAAAGFDWLMIDTEHSPTDAVSILPLLHAVEAFPVSTVVRPGSVNPVEMKKLLDQGVQTLLVPYVQNAEEARLAAAAVAYPPTGIRGVAGLTRASKYGAVPDYVTRARDEICLVVQIETLSAVAELDEICATPGVDAVFVGPADLAASLGYLGQPGHPEVRAAVKDAVRRIRAAGKPAGFLSPDTAYAEEIVEAGATFVAVGIDCHVLRQGALRLVTHWKG
ncbi:HpcH/HpaI aldolase/citrate lyase family protein [Acuticoccus sp. I52.16.1]|uniref:HpcH/HpaI aldolase family protein n=1 Tax=Acuticoccus sp. I52.16.1 TaxID=2928472 RepID=UPI001FD61CB0|nr:aldolase/citrate lyase family protein [Acuticoccus sp. I52.16.1]UOM34256.1 HpcH/HpaI aldolase/citrate lyase family protein [Acuticoccus sp. I52.16.1]